MEEPASDPGIDLVEAVSTAGDVLWFPDWGVRLHEMASPPADVVQGRLVAYSRLLDPKPAVVVATAWSVARLGMPKKLFRQAVMGIELQQVLNPVAFTRNLVELGYTRTDLVERPGQFAARGGIIDVFTPQFDLPIRIELFGDEIESLRMFAPSTQRSRAALLEAQLLPCSEVWFKREFVHRVKASLIRTSEKMGTEEEFLVKLLDDLDSGTHFPGLEWLLPQFYAPDSILDWIGRAGLVVLDGPAMVQTCFEEVRRQVAWETENNSGRIKSPVEHNSLWLDQGEVTGIIQAPKLLGLEVLNRDAPGEAALPSQGVVFDELFELHPETVPPVRGRWNAFFNELRQMTEEGYEVSIVGPQPADLDNVREMVRAQGFSVRRATSVDEEVGEGAGSESVVSFVCGNLTVGFSEPLFRRVYFTMAEVYGKVRRYHRMVPSREREYVSSFRDLKVGDYVVHLDHGIGRYVGLRRLEVQGVTGDFMELEYRNSDRLFVPISTIHLIQRYKSVSTEGVVQLDKLGAASWGRVKARVKKAIRQMAGHLLELYAARKTVQGVAFSSDDAVHHEFEARFEFDPTPDQQRTIDEVRRSMQSPRPMDRLICGDVGFGKTEIAMRAAHKATRDDYQVAILVPTTILAQQHFSTFRRRFQGFGVRIEMLSRFVTPKRTREILKDLEAGNIDIVIGTHKLLGASVRFRRLGLLVVDEEHRFGVAHKEKIKQLKKNVDALTLSATPIPRTLHMSLLQVRDLSLIKTPPVDRLPIITRLASFEDEVIREAIDKELNRGGQVFFIHNRIVSINEVAARIRKIVPNASIAVAHGQMDEKLLERIMVDFVKRRYHVLVCTAIVESGLDIPAANTMIINRADRFGLAQLYQLRGRVGRSRRRAHCLLLTPPIWLLGKQAQERLRVIQELTALGSGFRLAAHDMEIRGAGNLLGAEQHGHIEAIGFDTYCKLLEQTIQEIQGVSFDEEPEPTIRLDVDAYLPDAYMPDINQKLVCYRSLASAKSREAVREVEAGLIDRYGSLPTQAKALVQQADLTALCRARRVEKLELRRGVAFLSLIEGTELTTKTVRQLLQKHPGRVRFRPPRGIRLEKTDVPELVEMLAGLS